MSELEILQNETIDDFLWRLGCLKDAGSIHLTWPEQCTILNNANGDAGEFTESYWRKKYRKMQLDHAVEDKDTDVAKHPSLMSFFMEVEKQRIRAKDERASYTRVQRNQARQDAIQDLFAETIRAHRPHSVNIATAFPDREKAIYAMLSDIHYGIAFESYSGKYNSTIAYERIMRYADEIIRIGRMERAQHCYVSLMGDLISGVIHTTIRVENRENLIEQVIGVSETISDFQYKLAAAFESVTVNSVDGNHSRVDMSADDALRGEKLDALIPWYCKTKLQHIDNVVFQDNAQDSSIGSLSIFGKTYICVHGDMDNDLKASAQRIEQMSGHKVDYLLAAHMHVAECRMENVGYIRNGSICGSGDEYTVKKRLFGPPVQVCMIISKNGVDAIHPVKL